MDTKRYQLEKYKKYLLSRVSATPHVTDYIESCLVTEDEAGRHSFHKIMVHNWSESNVELFEVLSEYFQTTYVPVNYASQSNISTFYTSNLNLIMKIIKLDFMFPYRRNMFNVDILFNDKSSGDCFNIRVTVEDVVASVVSNRMNDKFELNLSNFCNDSEFIDKKIHFYKINLLGSFKILMLRMGRDTKSLNLSNNNLAQVPDNILNFFIKGELVAINLSNNNIPSLSDINRVSSKIEKLWLEGNPLCDDIDPMTYIKAISVKFPRVIELDGIPINQHGVLFPFTRNYLDIPDKKTTMLVEKFLTLYFSAYDTPGRKTIHMMYANNATLTIATNFTEAEEVQMPHFANFSRNALVPSKKHHLILKSKMYKNQQQVMSLLTLMPDTQHDPTSFTVDCLHPDKVYTYGKKYIILIVDGIFKEKYLPTMNPPERVFQFRHTFVLNTYLMNNNTVYAILHDMFNIRHANESQIKNSFLYHIRNQNSLALNDPDEFERDTIVKAFSHQTQLKRGEAELRMKINNWDIMKAMKEFINELRDNKISADRFMDKNGGENISDSSSSFEDDILD